MTRSRRMLLVVIGLAVVTTLVGVLVRGSSAPTDRAAAPATSSPTAPPRPATTPATTGDIMLGLKATGAGPTLSWTRVEGALQYQVAAVGPAGHWGWEGYGTSVVFGSLETTSDPMFWPDRPLIQVIQPRPGERYRWYVIAFTDKGQIAAMSELTSFTYQPPSPEAPLPPRPPRHDVPALSCGKLMPESITHGALVTFTLQESTPCGAELGLGCPISCGFSRRDDEGTTRVSFYFACDQKEWGTYPKPAGATLLPGVGRAAMIAQDDEDTIVLVHSASTKCIVKLRSALDRAATVALAKTLDASLKPDAMWMPPDWR